MRHRDDIMIFKSEANTLMLNLCLNKWSYQSALYINFKNWLKCFSVKAYFEVIGFCPNFI